MGARRRGLRRWLVAAPGWLLLASLLNGSTALAVEFSEIARFNISSTQVGGPAQPQDIGTHASAVAWQNGKLFLGGYNNNGLSLNNVGIVQVLNPTTTGIVASPSFGTAFSQVNVTGSRGFSGLALSTDGAHLAASLYTSSTGNPDGLQLFNVTASPNQLWRRSLAGGSGVAFDPGYFDGVTTTGDGVAWVSSQWATSNAGYDRRMLRSLAGADIWTTANGMQWFPDSVEGLSRKSRDIAFDPATGDMYTRISNDVGVARRNGGNSVHSSELLVDTMDANLPDNQHLAFLSTPLDGGMVIYNDRRTVLDTQAFADVVKLVSSTGTALAANFSFLDSYQPAAGAGWYDFDFDAASSTLALLDTSNFQVHIFQVGASAVVLDDADFDADGDVDGADFLTWQRHVGVNNGAATLAHGDGDGDEHVTVADLEIWRTQFGTASPAVQGVPEPAAWAMMGLAAAGAGALSRNRRAGFVSRA